MRSFRLVAIGFAWSALAAISAGTWVSKAPMPTARAAAGVGVLDGQIYVVGGFTYAGSCSNVAVVEVYDPATDRWSTKAPLSRPRFGVAVAVSGGRLYAIGGESCGRATENLVESYNPATNTWTSLPPLPGNSRAHASVAAIDGIIYVAGGYRDFNTGVASFSAFDTRTNTWSILPSLPTARQYSAGAAVGGRFHVFGGSGGNSGFETLNENLAFDPRTGSWAARPPMLFASADVGAVSILEKVYVVGGRLSPLVQVFDSRTGDWSMDAEVPGALTSAAIAEANRTIYAIGGWDSSLFSRATVRALTFPWPTNELRVTHTGTGNGTVKSTPPGLDCASGTCSATYFADLTVTLAATPVAGSVFTGWAGACSGTTDCTVSMNVARSVEARFAPDAVLLAVSESTMDFGGQSMNTSAPPRTFTIRNEGTRAGTLSFEISSPVFELVHDCATLAPGGSCTATVGFRPTFPTIYDHPLTIRSGTSVKTVSLRGIGERSLVTHYYQSILNRPPDTPGKLYWEGEATRLASLGVDINEVHFVMAGYFFNSDEYRNRSKNDAQFVTDLYNTFFNRGPDAGGLAYWTGQIAGGLPREIVLISFMFSPEFRAFTQNIFGNTAARAEVNLIVDFFRGLPNRLPDTASLNYWLSRLRVAQCRGVGAVYPEVDAISGAFMYSPEYGNRQRNPSQFVSDLYYSFLRRGGDLGGVTFWINELQSGRRNADRLRADFIASAEFRTRVDAVVSTPCDTRAELDALAAFLRETQPSVESIAGHLDQRISAGSPTPIEDAVSYLRNSRGLAARLSPDRASILTDSQSGAFSRGFLTVTANEVWTETITTPTASTVARTLAASSPAKNNKVLLVFPQGGLWNIGSTQDALISQLEAELRANGQQVDVIRTGQSTAANMLAMGQYGTIVMVTHGGGAWRSAANDDKTRTALDSGLLATEDNIRAMAAALGDGPDSKRKFAIGDDWLDWRNRIFLTTDFFRSLDLRGTLVLAMGCHSGESTADDPLLAEVTRQGGTLVGWQGQVSVALLHSSTRFLVQCLTKGKSAGECVQDAKTTPELSKEYRSQRMGRHSRISDMGITGNAGIGLSGLPQITGCGANTIRISGRVANATNGAAISGATITIAMEGSSLTATTNAAGDYGICVPLSLRDQTSDIILQVSHPSFVANAVPVSLALGAQTLNIALEPASDTVVTIEAALHHLGDSSFDGVLNSGLQRRTAEGLLFSKQFSLSGSQVPSNFRSAALELAVNGAECSNPVSINGRVIASLNNAAPGPQNRSIPFDIRYLVAGNNTFSISASYCETDYDDFEFSNVRIRFTR